MADEKFNPSSAILRSTISQIIGFGVGNALSIVLTPEATALAQESWSKFPTLVLPVSQAAQVAIKRPDLLGAMQAEAKASGYSPERFANIIDAVNSPPGLSELFDLWRRGVISDDKFRFGLQSAQMEPEWYDDLKALKQVLISPENLAMAIQQGFIGKQAAENEAAMQGVNAERLNLLFEMSGLPLGIGEGLTLLRRNLINEDRFRQMVVEGHTKIKYADDALALRWQPLSASVAAEALIRNRMPKAKAVEIAAQNGLREEDFLAWSEMIGRPIPVGEALTLARRGEFTYEQFVDAVARSDVRTEFAPDLWKLRRALPSLMQVRRMIAAGAISDAQASGILTDEGYAPDLVKAILEAEHHAKTAKTRDLAASQIDILYESGLEPKPWAIGALMALGYDEAEAELHLSMLDAKRIIAALNSQLNVIHRTYVGHKIDRETAIAEMDLLGIGAEALNLLLESWDNERAANVATLTNAQIGQALKWKIITLDDALVRWKQNGYSDADATVLAKLIGKGHLPSDTPTP